MLPEQRITTTRPFGGLSTHHESFGHEETRSGNAVHQLQNAGRLERRKREQQQE